MKIRFRMFSLVLSLFLLSYQLNAQLSPSGFNPAGKLIPKSPQASALIKYIDVPVSQYTGTPEVAVPITSIQEGKLKIPVFLSYHAAGHKVEEHANWVGLGWRLNAGGMITRKIHGIADDADVGQGFLDFRDNYSYDNEDSQESVHDWLLNYNEVKFQSLASGCWDSQPDEFYFSVNGLSGKFAFDWNNGGDPILSSAQDVKILSYTQASNSNKIIEWRLAGPDGTIYVFNALETTVVYDMFDLLSLCNSGNHSYTSGWHLTKVINPFNSGQYLELEYDNYTLQDNWQGFETRAYKMTFSSSCSGSYSGTSDFSQSRVDIQGKKLKRIKTSSNSFNLYLNANTVRTDVNQDFQNAPVVKRLDEIVLKDRSNQVMTQHLLDYYPSGRLKLKSVQQKGKSNTLLPPYEFTYDSHSLPSVNSRSVDHWGFANGAPNSTLLPSYLHFLWNTYVYFDGGDREPSFQSAKASILKEIKHPTGGTTEFDYELNDYGFIQSQTVASQDQYEEVHKVKGTSASNNSSTTTWVTQQTTFTVNQGNTVAAASISGTTHCTFLGHLYLPKARIEDASGNIIKQWTLSVIDGSQTSNPPSQAFNDDVLLQQPGTYTIICQAKKFINSVAGDHISLTVSFDDVDLAAPLSEKNTGGVRVKEIRNKDTNGDLENVRRFEYDMTDGTSSGVIYHEPRYVYTSANLVDPGIECNYVQVIGAGRVILGATSGSHIGYRRVTEYQGLNGENGKIVYEFTSPYNYGDQLSLDRPFAHPKSSSFKTGLIDKVTAYKKSGSTYSAVREQDYDYHFKTYDINSAKVSFGRVAPPLFSGLQLSSAYATYPFYDKFAHTFIPLRIGHSQVKKITQKDFFGSQTITNITQFEFDQDLQHLAERTITNSDGIQYISRMKYPKDFSGGTSSTMGAAISALKAKNVVAAPIEEMTYIKKPGQSEKLTFSKLTEYKNFSGDPYPYRSWATEFSSPVTSFTPAYLTSGGSFVKSFHYKNNTASAPNGEMTSYDSYGNLRQFNKYYDEASTLIWGHDYHTPIAHVKNAKTNEVAFTSFESGKASQGGWTYSSSGVWNSSSAFAGRKHRYLSYGAISKSSVPAGKYIVSFWGRYSSAAVKVNGTTVGTASYSSSYKYQEFELNLTSTSTVQISGGGYIDELRLHPKDAMMDSYTFDDNTRLILATADENQVHTHYLYDEFNRLQLVKDQDKNILQTYEYDYYTGSAGDNLVKSNAVMIPGKTSLSQVNALSGGDVRRVVEFFDGLSRPIQQIEVANSPLQRDVISFQEYDAFGRTPKKYLDYTYSSNGGSSMQPNTISRQNSFYFSLGGIPTSYAYTESEYESSPLNRVLKERPPGSQFRDHYMEYTYRSNNSNEVRLFINGNSTTTYPANTLFVVETDDENGNTSITYTDKLGRLILTSTEGAKTYNVYNDFGQREAVLPPEVVKDMTNGNNWNYSTNTAYEDKIFRYTYDSRRRILRKDMPGAKATEFRYDRLDRIRAEMDGRLKSQGFKWKYRKYDIHSRVVQTGIYSGSFPSVFHIAGNLYESRNTTTHGYTNSTWPTSSATLHKVTFYDDYDLNSNGTVESWEDYKTPTSSTYQSSNFDRVRGEETAYKVGILKTNGSAPTTWLYHQNFYDKYGQTIQTRDDNHLSEEDVVFYAYDFAGRMSNTREEHRANLGGTKIVNVDKRYVYDHAGRLLQLYQKTNGGTEIQLAKQRYNERSMLSEKKLHKTSSGYYLQDVDYTYNIRGWMERINSFSCGVINNGGGATRNGDQPVKSITSLRNLSVNLQFSSQSVQLNFNGESSTADSDETAPFTWQKQIKTSASIAKNSLNKSTPIRIAFDGLKITSKNLALSLLQIEDKIISTIADDNTDLSTAPIMSEIQQMLEQTLVSHAPQAEESTTSSRAVNSDSHDLFSMQLYYNSANTTLGAAARYNGDVSHMRWKVGCRDKQAYGFSYDTRNQMTKAYYGEIDNSSGSYKNLNRYTVDYVQYDLNGNLTRLRRRGPISPTSFSYIDDLRYTYSGNQMASLRDVYYYRHKGFEAPAYGYETYAYDDSGNMTRDNHKNMDVQYNHFNLPTRVDYDNGSWVEWTYDAHGIKLKKETSTGLVKHYIGSVEYIGNCIEAVYHDEGRVTPKGDACLATITNWQYEYTLSDHLGNARVQFADLNNDGKVNTSEIIQENNYYPFGMEMEGDWFATSGIENAYKYNGTELNRDFDLNVNSTLFRTYEPAIGRWWQIDPLAEMAQNYSPYNFSFNNPARFSDPLGDFPWPWKWFKKKGKKTGCYDFSKKRKKNRPPKGKKKKKKRKAKKKKKPKYRLKWHRTFIWSSRGGTPGTTQLNVDANNQITAPSTTHNIPNPPVANTIYQTRMRVSTRPSSKTTIRSPNSNEILFTQYKWNATVSTPGRNGSWPLYATGGDGITNSGANPGDQVLVTPILTAKDRTFLQNGGAVGQLNLRSRLRQLRLKMVVEELRVHRITYTGVWPFRKKKMVPVARRHPEHRRTN